MEVSLTRPLYAMPAQLGKLGSYLVPRVQRGLAVLRNYQIYWQILNIFGYFVFFGQILIVFKALLLIKSRNHEWIPFFIYRYEKMVKNIILWGPGLLVCLSPRTCLGQLRFYGSVDVSENASKESAENPVFSHKWNLVPNANF